MLKLKNKFITFFISSFIVLSINKSYSEEIINKELTTEEKIYGLSEIWQEANYNFANFDLVPELDWNKKYREFIPKVLETKNLYEYYKVLDDFTSLLKDGHSYITYPENITIPFDIAPLQAKSFQNRAYIIAFEKSLANQFSLGDEIIKVNNIPLEKFLKETIFPLAGTSTLDSAIHNMFMGEKNSEIELTLKKLNGNISTVKVKRNLATITSPDFITTKAKKEDIFTVKNLNNGILYLGLKTFDDDSIINSFKQSLTELYKAKGLIIDLRKNSGGSALTAIEISKYLIPKDFYISSTKTRKHIASYKAYGNLYNMVPDKVPDYAVYKNYASGKEFEITKGQLIKINQSTKKINAQIIVLTSNGTASAAEDFVVMLDYAKRITKIGQRTHGSTGQPLFFNLPGGGEAAICTKRDTYPDGKEFAGTGIIPDIEINQTINDYLNNKDVTLEEAVKVLKAKIN